MTRPKSDNPKNAYLNIRLTKSEKEKIEAMAKEIGFSSISDFVRHASEEYASNHLSSDKNNSYKISQKTKRYFKTDWGEAWLGDALDYLLNKAKPSSVDLIMTSPPFGLVRKKDYGNEDADRYCDWFRPFAHGIKRVLKDRGSFVIDIGGAWKSGQPTRSLYHFELLSMLCNEFGFHLAQEHYWWNPSKLPTPAEWVNIRRVRVKDAVNTIWWLSLDPFPKANNRKVLAPYSKSMQKLLKDGYKAKKRPSGHDISTKFGVDNGGSVPPNLLAVANTESNGQYQDYCRDNGIQIHPARFPADLPTYFIKFLTDPNDLVLDPFAGSCVTGAVCEDLRRRWICCELSEEYLQGARGRFPVDRSKKKKPKTNYSISAPVAILVDEKEVTTISDGGKNRPSSTGKKTPSPQNVATK